MYVLRENSVIGREGPAIKESFAISQKASTMVRTFPLAFTPDLFSLFYLTPVEFNVSLFPSARGKKVTPSLTPIGTVISARLKPLMFGVPGGFFNSTVMIKISMGDSYVTIRFSEGTLHVCGMKTDLLLDIFVYYSLNILRQAQRNLEDLHRHNAQVRDLAMWFSTECAGPPPHADVPIISHLLQRYKIPHSAQTFFDVLWRLASTSTVYTGVLRILEVNYCMSNYDFHLGYPVDIYQMGLHFEQSMEDTGFIPRYDNEQQMLVIEKICEGRSTKRKSKPSVSFMIRESGHIRVSGPEIQLISQVQGEFLMVMRSFGCNRLTQ